MKPKGRVKNRAVDKVVSESTFRSRYEIEVAANFDAQELAYEYESITLPYLQPVIKGVCSSCGACKVAQKRTYTPDFGLKNTQGKIAFFVETKGLFTSENRRTLLLVKQQLPDVEVRMLFMRNNKIHKNNPKLYGDWCNEHGIKWAVGKEIPYGWREELRQEIP